MPDCSAERKALTSHHQEALTSLLARYEILVSIQDRIVEHDRRFGLASEVDEGLLERPTWFRAGYQRRIGAEGRRPLPMALGFGRMPFSVDGAFLSLVEVLRAYKPAFERS